MCSGLCLDDNETLLWVSTFYGVCDDYLHVFLHGSPSKGLIVGGAFCFDEGCGTWVKGEG